MRPVTSIDDPRYVKAMSHPLRVRILAILLERTASPVELAQVLEGTLGTVSYHVRTLHQLGLIELVDETRVRGAVEHHYRAAARPDVSDEAWEQAPPIAKQAAVGSSLQMIDDYARASAAAGGFDHADAALIRLSMKLDAKGWQQLAEGVKRLYEQAQRIEADARERLDRGAPARGGGDRRRPRDDDVRGDRTGRGDRRRQTAATAGARGAATADVSRARPPPDRAGAVPARPAGILHGVSALRRRRSRCARRATASAARPSATGACAPLVGWLVVVAGQVAWLRAHRRAPRPARPRRSAPPRSSRLAHADRHAAVALQRAPLGGRAAGGLHARRLAVPGVAHRADLAHPDRRQRARPARAALRPGRRDRDDGVGRRARCRSRGSTARRRERLVDELTTAAQATRGDAT